jgi:hypothetical protein
VSGAPTTARRNTRAVLTVKLNANLAALPLVAPFVVVYAALFV